MNQPFWIGGGTFFHTFAVWPVPDSKLKMLSKDDKKWPLYNWYKWILTNPYTQTEYASAFFLPQPSCSGSHASHFHLQKPRCESSSAKVHDEPKLLGAARPRRILVFAGKRRGGIEQPEMMKYPRKKYLKKSPHKWRFFHGKAWNVLASPKKI